MQAASLRDPHHRAFPTGIGRTASFVNVPPIKGSAIGMRIAESAAGHRGAPGMKKLAECRRDGLNKDG
jgi:hypothetical protein